MANRLNFPIGESLNWRNSIFGSRDFMDATPVGTRGETRPQTEVENFTFHVMHSFLTLPTALLASLTSFLASKQ